MGNKIRKATTAEPRLHPSERSSVALGFHGDLTSLDSLPSQSPSPDSGREDSLYQSTYENFYSLNRSFDCDDEGWRSDVAVVKPDVIMQDGQKGTNGVKRRKKGPRLGCIRGKCFACTENRLSLPYCIYDVRWGQDSEEFRGGDATVLENTRGSEPDVISACIAESENERPLDQTDAMSCSSIVTSMEGPSLCEKKIPKSLSSLEGSNVSIPSIYWRKKHSILMIRSRIRNDGFDWTSMCSLFGGKVDNLDSSDVDSVFDCRLDDAHCMFSRESVTSDLSHSVNGSPLVPLVEAESIDDLYDLDLSGPKSPTKRKTRRPTLCRPESFDDMCNSAEAMENQKVTVSSSSGVVSSEDLAFYESTNSPTLSVIENPAFVKKNNVNSKNHAANRRISLDETRSENSPSVERTKWRPRRLQCAQSDDSTRQNKMSSDLDLFSVLFETTCPSMDSLCSPGFTSPASLQAINLSFRSELDSSKYDIKDYDSLQAKFQSLAVDQSSIKSDLSNDGKRLSQTSTETGSPAVKRSAPVRRRRRKRTDGMMWDYTDIFMYNDEASGSDYEDIGDSVELDLSSEMLEWEMGTHSGSRGTGCSQSCGSQST